MQAITKMDNPLFVGEVNHHLLAQAVRVYLGNQRQATAKTKTRSEINRSKKKWFKQKGTGNARHGARTPALFVGGGVVHGPTGEQNYKRTLSSKMKHKALQTALLAQAERVFVGDEVLAVTDGKTKSAVKALGDKLQADDRVLIIVKEKTPQMVRAYNNLPTVYLTTGSRVNLLQVTAADIILLSHDGLQALQERLLGDTQDRQISGEGK